MVWRLSERISAPLAGALAMGLVAMAPPMLATASEVTSDAKYLLDNTQLDLVDVLTSPLHIADPDSVLRSPTFYLVLAGVGGLWAGSFALDKTMRANLHHMSSSDADLLQR